MTLIPVRLGVRGTTTAGPHHEGGSGDFGQPTQQHVFHGRLAAQSPLNYKSTILYYATASCLPSITVLCDAVLHPCKAVPHLLTGSFSLFGVVVSV